MGVPMAVGRPKAALVLTSEQREQLEGLASSRSLPAGLVMRARIILLSASGKTNLQIARQLELTNATVGKWRRRFLKYEVAGLHDELRPGRPRPISDERVAQIGRGRPGRNTSCNPATSYFRKRRRHLPTVALVSSNCRAICRFVLPEALSKIILARITNPAGRDRELAKPSSCSRCSGFKTKANFGRPIAIGTPILHWRYLNSQQYYCHLFMGQYTSSSAISPRRNPIDLSPLSEIG